MTRWTGLVWVALAASCSPELEPLPHPGGGSFGERFFTVSCQRVAYTSSLRAHLLDPTRPVDVSGSRYRLACRHGPGYLPANAAALDPKVATLVRHRDPMVAAVDLVFPGDELSDLQDYMISILPLTDNDVFPAVVRSGARVLAALDQDQELHWSLARLEGRVGYRPRLVCLGLMREVLSYPQLHPTLSALLDVVGEGGPGHRPLLELAEALSFELRSTRGVHDPALSDPMHPGAADRPLRLALDLLLEQHPAFSGGSGPMLVVRRDWRGVARVRQHPGTETLPGPFVDQDQDGLADIDTLGNFVTAPAGAPAPSPFHLDASKPDPAAQRDLLGRALDHSGAPLFEYLDLDTTLLAGLGREAATLFDRTRRTATRLLVGAGALMGRRQEVARQAATGELLRYNGFNTAEAPLLDLIHAALQTLRDPNVEKTLEAADLLLAQHEHVVARLVAAALDAKDRGKKPVHQGAQLDPKSNFYDDLIVVVQKIANTDNGKLLEDLLGALADPATRNLGPMLANYMRYRDVHDLDQKTLEVVNPSFTQLVDRTKPDSGTNRSIQGRLGHVLQGSNGMKICNKENACIGLKLAGQELCIKKFKECEVFEVENGALFYAQSIARLRDGSGKLTDVPKAHVQLKTDKMGWVGPIVEAVGQDTVLELLSGIEGMSTHPTTEAINRLMFINPLPTGLALFQDPVVDINGHQVNTFHVGSLLSWEVPHPQFSCTPDDPCTFFDAIRPVVQAFADHDAEQLFIDLMEVLHVHWATPKSSAYQFTDPAAPDYCAGSGVVTYEPLVAEILTESDLMPALRRAAQVLGSLQLADGQSARSALVKTVAFLVDPTRSPGLTYRDGRTTSTTTDGTKQVPGGVSPFYLFADAFAAKAAALSQADPLLADAWRVSTSDLVDLFLSAEGAGDATRFKNRRVVPALRLVIDLLRQRLAAHRAAGDIGPWLGTELPSSVEQKLGGPVVARAVDLLRVLEQATPARDALHDLLAHLIDELGTSPTFRASLTGIADLAQLLLDDQDVVPLLRAVGRVLEPEQGLVQAALRFLKPAVALDARQSLVKILRNAYRELSPGRSPLQTLLDLATELHRVKPGAGTPYTGPDFQEALRQAQEFFADQQTGLEKFFEIVKNRCGGPCGAE